MPGLQTASISRTNVLARGLWTLAWLVLARFTPRPFHTWRCMLLRLFGAKIGKRVRVYQSCRIWAPWNLQLDDDSCLGDDVHCYNVAQVTLEANAVVSQFSFLCTASHDYTTIENTLVSAPIVIGASAWITADVFVAPGVTIGEGSVVTARSSVFHDIAPWSVASGNPAKRLKERVLRERQT